MENRERELFKNNVFRIAIFMDPRYNVLLSEEDKLAAKEQLLALWKRLYACSDRGESVPSTSANVCENACHDIKNLLRRLEFENRIESVRNINNILNTYLTWKRIPKESDVLAFWETKRNAEPELYKLARVVLSAPATQVSVERLFSGVKHIVSHLRYNLQMHVTDDIMGVRCKAIFNK